jgi:outer membrane lipoprotein-sorting protein
MRLQALLALTGLAITSAPATALTESEKQDVIRVEAYINAIRTLRTDFTQIAPNGAVARGTIYISRPGRLRVEYRPPAKLRIFATPQWLIVEDCKVKEPQYLPLRSTPAGILIQETIQLSGDLSVSEVKRQNRWLTVRIVETKATDKGSINLVFQLNPFQITGWTVIDHQGLPTQVTFENTQVGSPLDPTLFNYIGKCD